MKKQEKESFKLRYGSPRGSFLEIERRSEKIIFSEGGEATDDSTHLITENPVISTSTLGETMNDLRGVVTTFRGGVDTLKWTIANTAPWVINTTANTAQWLGAVIHTTSTLLNHLDK